MSKASVYFSLISLIMEALFPDLFAPPIQTQFLKSKKEHIWIVTIATPRSLESDSGNSTIDCSPLLQLGYGFEVAWGERPKVGCNRQTIHFLWDHLTAQSPKPDGKTGHSLCTGTFVLSAAPRALCLGLFATVSAQSSNPTSRSLPTLVSKPVHSVFGIHHSRWG